MTTNIDRHNSREPVKQLAKEMQGLTRSHKELQRQVGGISNTIGYSLEDKAYPILPALL